MARITSNKPFSRQCNIRQGSGPVYTKFCEPPNVRNNVTRSGTVGRKKEPCFGPYDNLVKYVFEVDTSTGNRLGYVDCDYVG